MTTFVMDWPGRRTRLAGCTIALTVVGLIGLHPLAAIAQQQIPGYDYSNPVNSARGLEPTALSDAIQPVELVDLHVMPGIDRQAVAVDDEIRAEQNLPHRFAIPNEVFYTPANAGTWEALPRDRWLWRLRVVAPDAKSINFGFTRFVMPPGGTLFIYSTDLQHRLRAFTAADNEAHGQLWTPPVPGDDVVIEVTIPAAVRDQLELELTKVNHGYRGFFDKDAADAQSGSCNVDVACPDSAGWENEIPGVAAIAIDGAFACTGFLVNNTSEDRTPYFMTANHCGLIDTNAASLIAFWNYQNSTCRTPGSVASGSAGDGTLDDFNTGSVFLADYVPSDFTLVQLDDQPDPVYQVTYLGWNRASGDFASAVVIHHPQVEEKRISFENDATATTSYSGTTSPGDGTHIRIIDWDLGTTEGGSSGSPLVDPQHRVIGQLHGGGAACGNNESDWFGRFSVSWDGGGMSINRLSDWLDPLATGAMTIDTLGPLIDCNANGIHDPEEIAAMIAPDCNMNGIPDACDLGSYITENMDSVGALPNRGWVATNNSDVPLDGYCPGVTCPSTWLQGTSFFPSFNGSTDSDIVVRFDSTDSGTISNWLISPEVDLIDGKTFSFWTRTLASNPYPDRLQVRLSTAGASTDVGTTSSDVGDFTTLLVDINPTLTVGGYPEVWTEYNLALSGIGTPTTGRFAFRYFVADSGPFGANGYVIGIDKVEYYSGSNDIDNDGIPDECAPACPEDVDGGGSVDVVDLLALLADWGPCIGCPADFDGNDQVDVLDLLALLAAWGPCP